MKHLTRKALIDRMRDYLHSQTDDESSVCMVAAQRGIFCKGFSRFSEDELKQTFYWISRSRPTASREELEDAINKYKLARQQVLEAPLSCDAQMFDRDTCLGWDEFSDEELIKFHEQLLGEEVEIVGPGWTKKADAS